MDQGKLIFPDGSAALAYSAPSPQLGYDMVAPLGHHASLRPRSSRGWRAMLWGMGGTILSIAGFIGMMLFEEYNGMLAELRSDLKHFNETSSEYVKKDSLQKMREQMRDWYKEMQAANFARARTEEELRASEKAREEMTRELQRMRERLAFLEGRQASLPHPTSLSPEKQ